MVTKSDLQKQVEKMEAGQVVYDIGMQTFSEEQWKTFDGALEASLLLTYTVDEKKNITNVKVGTAENALEKAMEKYEINIIIAYATRCSAQKSPRCKRERFLSI